jgi:hypothetical protein
MTSEQSMRLSEKRFLDRRHLIFSKQGGGIRC